MLARSLSLARVQFSGEGSQATVLTRQFSHDNNSEAKVLKRQFSDDEVEFARCPMLETDAIALGPPEHRLDALVVKSRLAQSANELPLALLVEVVEGRAVTGRRIGHNPEKNRSWPGRSRPEFDIA